MSKSSFQTKWCEIAARWKLRIETPFVVAVSSGSVTVPVLLRDFGASKGMLLVTDFKIIAPYSDELITLGFGYSCLSEPRDPYDPSTDDASLREMLEDWGWTGSDSPPSRFHHQAS